jgi:hypothetical protein
MFRAPRQLLPAALALAVLAVACAPALARTVRVAPAGEITMASEGNLTFTGRGLMEITTSCPVSFAGSLASSFESSLGSVEGTLTSVTVGRCLNVAVNLIGASPLLVVTTWIGGYPRELTAILLTINNLSARVVIIGTECLYRVASLGLLATVTWVGHRVLDEYLVNPRKRILVPVWNLTSGGGACPSTLEVAGTLRTSPAQEFRVE